MTADTQLLYFLNNAVGQSPLTDGIIVFFATYLAYVLIIVFLILVLSASYSGREKLLVLLETAAATLIARFGITELIRLFYHRPRPFVTLDVYQLIPQTSWAFPSGHATFFFALSTAAYIYNKRWGIAFYLATLLMTASRVAAGVHYPSDILGGALIGIAVTYAVFYIVRKILPKRG